MAYFSTTQTFTDGDQVTSTTLNAIVIGLRLGADSVDATTITVSAGGVLSVGTLSSSNYGALSVGTAALAAGAVTAAKLGSQAVETANIKLLNVTGATIAEETIAWSKTLTADRAVQADMQSQTASHYVSPDVLKYHPGIAKASGVITMATGAIGGGYGITGSASGTSTTRTVTLSQTMANTNYAVIFSLGDTGVLANAPVISAKTTTTFTVISGSTTVDFAVFGQLA